jgi:hypothetical protein
MEGITKLAKQEITTLTKKDMIVIWGGANDIARNEANNALTHIINYVESRKHTNVLIVTVPTRFDLISTSCVNKEVITYNTKVTKWMKQSKHVKLINCDLQRKCFTRHGMHMNLTGKELMSQRITEHINELFSKKETSTITLQWKQEMDKRTALTREYDPETNTNASIDHKQEKQTLVFNNKTNESTDTNSVIGCSVDKATLPKRDKKCFKEKNEDFLWY